MTAPSLAQRALDAFNQHGSFAARLVEHGLAVEIRLADTGDVLTTLWSPVDAERWAWIPPGSDAYRWLDSGFSMEQLVRIVATSILDERPKR